MPSTKMSSCLTTLIVLIILPSSHLKAAQLKEVKLGDRVELKCSLSFYNDIHWLKMSEGQPVALMVTSLKHNGEQAVVWNYNETRFEGFMEKQMTGLRILNLSTSDLATYYCATVFQKRLDFDKGVQLRVNNTFNPMPFGCVPARNPLGSPILCLLLLFAFCVGGVLALSAVKVKDTATIPCFKPCNGDISWALLTKNEKLDVLRCARETCTVGDSFRNRVNLSEKINSGNVSLTLHHAMYNDEGWYEGTCNSDFLCKFHLEVFAPAAVNAAVGGNVILPCYAQTKKRITDNAINIWWKRGVQTVLRIQNGMAEYGYGFTGRASVVLPHYRDGDLSLTLIGVTTSDMGLYRCYHTSEDNRGDPGAVTLTVTAHQKVWVRKFGGSLSLDLFGTDLAMVTFTGSKGPKTLVCSLKGSNTTCSPEYTNRAFVKNGSFVLTELTAYDTGTFILNDNMGEVISNNTVTVEGGTRRHIAVIFSVTFLFFCSLFLVYRYCQAWVNRCHNDAAQHDVNPEPEPASIGLSQQEVSLVVLPFTNPVPLMSTKMKDNSEEEGCKVLH